MRSLVSEKGQVTIPKRLRERLGIMPGQTLDFHEEDGRLVATKVVLREPAEQVYGVLETPKSSDEILRELRGPDDDSK